MTLPRPLPAVLVCLGLLGLAGCSNPEKTARYLIDPPADAGQVANRLGSAELKDVSLPEYASAQEVAFQTADGAVRSNPRSLWADNPQRAFTLSLARAISDASGATVIGEPWPLAEPPQRLLEVRVERALAQANGIYRLSGRYFVSDQGSGGANHARSFDIAVPMQDTGPAASAAAASRAIAILARQIATLSGPGRTIATTTPADPFALDPLFGELRMRACLVVAATIWLAGAALAGGAGPLPADALADYQLGGAYSPAPGVTVLVRDSTDQPRPGLFNICYVNGFQTQPGADWPAALLVPGPQGTPLADPDWPDEFLLDISTPRARQANLARLLPVIPICADKGFDAVEFDNLDSFTRSGGHLSAEDALAFARMLTAAAQGLGLPAGQKNMAELGTRGRDEAGFAFAIAEECHRWDECAAYTGVYGAGQVIGIEYADDLRGDWTDACADPDRPASMILRDRLLMPRGAAGHVFVPCPDGPRAP